VRRRLTVCPQGRGTLSGRRRQDQDRVCILSVDGVSSEPSRIHRRRSGAKDLEGARVEPDSLRGAKRVSNRLLGEVVAEGREARFFAKHPSRAALLDRSILAAHNRLSNSGAQRGPRTDAASSAWRAGPDSRAARARTAHRVRHR